VECRRADETTPDSVKTKFQLPRDARKATARKATRNRNMNV
jgi:hypothetical protein